MGEISSAAAETINAAYRTSTYRSLLGQVHEMRLRRLSPEARQAVRRENALLIGMGGLLALLIDLRHSRDRSGNHLATTIRWSSRAHGWVLR